MHALTSRTAYKSAASCGQPRKPERISSSSLASCVISMVTFARMVNASSTRGGGLHRIGNAAAQYEHIRNAVAPRDADANAAVHRETGV